MATYAQVLAKIKAALSLRPANTKVAVAKHEEAEIAILDYIEAAKATFAEKYNSPYNGTANTILSKAIRDMKLREIEDALHLYVAYFDCGSFDGSHYNYALWIYQADPAFGESQEDTKALIWTDQVDSPHTGMVDIMLEEDDGSGRYGNMAIDFSALPVSSEYVNQSFSEGSLFGYSLISDMGSVGGGASFLKRESFTATEGQTVFTPSKFKITEDALVLINQAIQSPDTYTIEGNTLTFSSGCTVDDVVIILN